MVDEWVQAGKWWVNQRTGETRAEAPPTRPTASSAEFDWKGHRRRIPMTEAAKSIYDRAPNPAFARWLHALLLSLKSAPDPRRCGYRAAQLALDVDSVMATFRPLGEVQHWCRREGLFDLSSLIVNKTGVPGSGHYVSDTVHEEEWARYIQLAIEAVQAFERGS